MAFWFSILSFHREWHKWHKNWHKWHRFNWPGKVIHFKSNFFVIKLWTNHFDPFGWPFVPPFRTTCSPFLALCSPFLYYLFPLFGRSFPLFRLIVLPFLPTWSHFWPFVHPFLSTWSHSFLSLFTTFLAARYPFLAQVISLFGHLIHDPTYTGTEPLASTTPPYTIVST